jgi:hypothetical protein
MPNRKNLVSLSERTTSEQREIAKKGGKASGEARRKKANLKKTIETLLTLELPESTLKDQLEEMGIDPTIEQGLVMRVLLTAIQDGNYKALEAIARLIQQTTTPADKKEQKARTEQMQLANERLKLELDPSQAGMKDDGFIEALQQEVADVWADEEPPSD